MAIYKCWLLNIKPVLNLVFQYSNLVLSLQHNSQGVPCFGTIGYLQKYTSQTERQAEIKPIV